MTDFLLTDDEDLFFENGGYTLVTGIDEVIQRLKVKLGVVLGEWFPDTTQGVPYFEQILVKNPDFESIQSIFKSTILNDPDVDELLEFDMDQDKESRKLTVTFRATINGNDESAEITI